MRIPPTKAMASSSLGRALERLVQTGLGVRVDRLNLGGISEQRSTRGREKIATLAFQDRSTTSCLTWDWAAATAQ